MPPYGRAGLYKQMAELKALLGEYREQPEASEALKGPILELLASAGLQEDCPFADPEASAAGVAAAASSSGSSSGGSSGAPAEGKRVLLAEDAEGISTEAFTEYASRVYQYLQVRMRAGLAGCCMWFGSPPRLWPYHCNCHLGSRGHKLYIHHALPDCLQTVENRLFSEGLHVLGQPPAPAQAAQYLSGALRRNRAGSQWLPPIPPLLVLLLLPLLLNAAFTPSVLPAAYFGEDLPAEAVEVVAAAPPGESLDALRARLDRIYRQPQASTSSGGGGSRCGLPASGPSRNCNAEHAARLTAQHSLPAMPSHAQAWQMNSSRRLLLCLLAALQCCCSSAPPEVREDKLAEAVRIRDLLALNTEELRSVGRALNGEYILPEAGGDLLRDGAGEMRRQVEGGPGPTGRPAGTAEGCMPWNCMPKQNWPAAPCILR